MPPFPRPRHSRPKQVDEGRAESYYVLTVRAMLRNKTLAVLQKTYDDSYLSCSTAVYYESQVGLAVDPRYLKTRC